MYLKHKYLAKPFRYIADEPTFTPEQEAEIQKRITAEVTKAVDAQKATTQKALDEANALRTKANLTSKEREELDSRIAELEATLLTKDQLTERELEKTRKSFENTLTEAQKDRDQWKERFTESTIMKNLMDAAMYPGQEARTPQHIVALLKPQTSLIEVKGEDNTITHEVRVKFHTVDKNKKPITLDLSPVEAVKQMSEQPEHANLFKATLKSGVGDTNNPNKKIDISTISKDAAAYREARKKGEI